MRQVLYRFAAFFKRQPVIGEIDERKNCRRYDEAEYRADGANRRFASWCINNKTSLSTGQTSRIFPEYGRRPGDAIPLNATQSTAVACVLSPIPAPSWLTARRREYFYPASKSPFFQEMRFIGAFGDTGRWPCRIRQFAPDWKTTMSENRRG